MKKHALTFCLVIAGLLVQTWGQSVMGEEKERTPQLWYLHEDIVIPSKIGEYEKMSKEFIQVLSEHNIKSFDSIAIQIDYQHFYFAVPLENMGGIDKMMADWMKFSEIYGKEKMEASGATTSSYNDKVYLERPDLSYFPENPRVKAEDANAFHFLFHYVQPGKESAFEDAVKNYVKFLKSNNKNNIGRTFQLVVGDGGPLYVVEIYGKDIADVVTHLEEEFKSLGNEGMELRHKIGANMRSIETKNGVLRRDLSTIKFRE